MEENLMTWFDPNLRMVSARLLYSPEMTCTNVVVSSCSTNPIQSLFLTVHMMNINMRMVHKYKSYKF